MAFNTSVTFVDAYGRTSTKRFVNTAALIADAITDAAALVDALQLVTGAGVLKYEVIQVTQENEAPVALSNVDAGATLHLRLDNSKLYPFKIPAILPALVQSDGAVLIDDVAITGLMALFDATGEFLLSETNYQTAIVGGELDR